MDLEHSRQYEFPVTSNRIFFDHAKVTPLPRRVHEAVHEFTHDAMEHGTVNYDRWMSRTDEVRSSFARLINAETDEVAFIKNTSEGISIVANGVDWKPGDNVVIPDIEFPANVYPWMNLEPHGVETRFVRSREGRVPFEDIANAVDARTRVISVSSVECNSGFHNDLERIGAFCKEKKILFCVDAIQSLGVLPMDVRKYGIDCLAADGHKWLLSVEGLGGLFVSREALDAIHPAVVGWDSVVDAHNFMDYNFTLRPGTRRFEEGTFNVMSILGFGAALSLFHELGVPAIRDRIFALGDVIHEELGRRSIAPYNSTLPEERSGIISFQVPGDPGQFARAMHDRNISLTVRDGLVRVSPHFYNNEDEIQQFFTALDEFLKTR